MADVDEVLDLIKENDVKYVDFRFTDPRGKWQHTAAACADGRRGSADRRDHVRRFVDCRVEGINESDMMLMPDLSTAVIDPFAAQTQLIVVCDIVEPVTGQPYDRDPRSIAKKAEAYLAASGHRRHGVFRPRGGVLRVRRRALRSRDELGVLRAGLRGRPVHHRPGHIPDGNPGHRPGIKGGYFPVPPVDSAGDMRAEMLTVMRDMGLPVEKHHHEVAPSQRELGATSTRWCKCGRLHADLQIRRAQRGAPATARRRPSCPSRSCGDNGSGMHVHQSIWKDGKPTVRRRRLCRPVGHRALLYRRHHQARQGAERLHQPDHQQLQAADPGLRGAGAAGLFGAQPLGLVPHPLWRQPESQARRGPLPRPGAPIPISPSPPC